MFLEIVTDNFAIYLIDMLMDYSLVQLTAPEVIGLSLLNHNSI